MIVVVRDIPKPIDMVWSAVARLEDHAQWMADAERIEFLSRTRRGVGAAMSVRTRVGPFATDDIIEVWEWSEGSHIGVTHRGLVSGIGMFVLVATDTGTRFVWWEHLRFPWYLGGSLAAAFARPVLRHVWARNLDRFAASLG